MRLSISLAGVIAGLWAGQQLPVVCADASSTALFNLAPDNVPAGRPTPALHDDASMSVPQLAVPSAPLHHAKLTSNSSLLLAQELVAAAQAEARRRNARLQATPRRNLYQFRQGSPRLSTKMEDGGTVIHSALDSTGVNATVGAAVALVAEAQAQGGGSGSGNQTIVGNGGMTKRAGSYWMESMDQNGASPFAPSGYKVWRNVKEYGAVGDGSHDDTDAINRAISDGNRCGQDCGSSTTLQAVVYFPAGTYLVSRSLVAYYFTQMIGDATNPPIIKVAPSFVGLGVISSDVYIEGGNGASWYINQNNFYRQVRNFVIDMTAAPLKDYIAGLHWQVAQATSLQNIKFLMSTAAGNNQQGIFMENGSGGLMNDLEFIGGAMGAYVGNQQFTVRNLKFSGQLSQALQIHWDWGWTWKGVQIDNCPVGVVMSSSDNTLGSAIFLDSSLTNVPVGWQLSKPSATLGKISLNLFNVALNNVATAVKYDNGQTLLAGGSQTIQAWGLGKRYDTVNSEASGVWQDGAHYERVPTISPSLLGGGGKFLERSKPQYEGVAASQFINIKTQFGAAGDGKSDDTDALNRALRESSSSGRILWIPAGVYLVYDTVTIPAGAKVVGQSWSQIMGLGVKFSDKNNPRPIIQVGIEGDVGDVEIQDLLFTAKGATAGAIVLQWNLHEASPGSAAMWDTHIRIGGAIGSELQAGNCPKLTGNIQKSCVAASMLVHITSKASAYFENTWFWVADHDLDTPAQTQIDIYVGRGMLIESTGPVWLYGTASEHCVLYQYQTLNAGNIFMGMIQTESPYYQSSPAAPEPFSLSSYFPSDPTFEHCSGGSPGCAFSWGVRILNSSNIYIYGAGLYSWFQKYSQACVQTEDCQDRIFEIEASSHVWVFSLITKASVEMISPAGGVSVLGKDNKFSYCDIIIAWMGSAGSSGSSGITHRSPASATIIPFPATTVRPTETFTLAGPVVSQVDMTYNDGYQNAPPGPGEDVCPRCDLSRLLTSTCCGLDGGVSNPMEIGAGTPIPRPLFLPAGFIPNQQVMAADETVYTGGQPLPREILIPIGTIFPIPFIIPPGLPLSNTWSPVLSEDKNGTLYLVGDFWSGNHSVFCSYPCTLVFPPLTTSTTWTPPIITYQIQSTTTSTIIPPYTTELIRVSKTTVQRELPAKATHTIDPKPHPKPLCFRLPLIGIRLCPPELKPFPPPVPTVTIIPIPPGGKPGPTAPGNRPTPEEEQEEEEEEEEEKAGVICSTDDVGDFEEDGYDDSYPGAGEDNTRPDYTQPGAGVGAPKTVTVTVSPVPKETAHITTAPPPPPPPPPSTSSNPYPFTFAPRGEDYTVLCETSQTLEVAAGWTVSQCWGSKSTIGTPRPKPTQSEPPKPEPTNGWYKCNDGETGPWAGKGCQTRSWCSSQPVGQCSELCDKVVSARAKGESHASMSKANGLGMSTDLWMRGRKKFGDDRDCPLDKDNCMTFCRKAAAGPVAKGPKYCGAYSYGCDKSGKRKIAVFNVQGGCGPSFGRS